MKAKLVGKQIVDFYDKENQRIQGLKLHVVGIHPNVRGEACLTPFFRVDHPLYETAVNIPLGDINLEYGQRNAVVGLESI